MNSKRRDDRDVSVRLARIQGHLSGIARMLDEGRPYSELVHQISAVGSSLDSLVLVILENLLSDCSASFGQEAMVSKLEEFRRVVLEIRSTRP